MKILVVGGGPAGLFLAYLLRKRGLADRVRVIEQNAPGATYGFGVVLASGGLQRIRDADESVSQLLTDAMWFNAEQRFVHRGDLIWLDRAQPGGAIERLALLRILAELCRLAGVEIEHGRRIAADEDWGDHDLVVGADGANSVVRRRHEAAFGTATHHLSNRFAWYGVAKGFPCSTLNFRTWRGGTFVGHYYPYGPALSTFVMECDRQTWDTLRLVDKSDAEKQRLTEEIFADELDGLPLIANNSIWRHFPVITNARWSVGNSVLLGDALQTAHPSIGSGTRLALEDAVVLAEALGEHRRDIPAALAAFEHRRSPERAKLTSAADRSCAWYEQVGEKMRRFDAVELAYDFLMRTGRISPERLRREFPRFMARWDARQQAASADA